MKIKVLLKEATLDATPKMQNPISARQQLPQSKIQELIAGRYGMKVVGDISVGETVYSDVYRVEPEDLSSYPTKTLVMKLSANDTEYAPYERIKNIRDRMLKSKDEADKKAANYLPIVYLAQPLEINNDNSKYKSVIIMEPLVAFIGNLKNMPSSLTSMPTRTPKLLVTMLKDEEFLNRVIGSVVSNNTQATQIENLIFTGKIPNTSVQDQAVIDSIIKTRLSNANMFRKIPEKPIEAYKSADKLTDQDRQKIIAWEDAYDKESKEFSDNMKRIKQEMRRIGFIFIDVLGAEGPDKFQDMINVIRNSTPVAPVSDSNPYPQNIKTRPEEVTPGAANFNDALQRLEQYGMSRKDLHGKNYMMREDGQIVISDPGLFQAVTPIKESKNANYKI